MAILAAPESPTFLAMKGRLEKARRGKHLLVNMWGEG
jgi:hypothetical protein